MRLALGTVQFGLAYGVANQSGNQIDRKTATDIIDLARSRGIRTLDTAIAYGNSEETLGRIGIADMEVVTKLPGMPDHIADVSAWVREQIGGSLSRLGVQPLHAVLLHRPDQLLGPQGPALYQALQDIRTDGITRKIGVSIYQPAELDALFEKMHFDLVQAPLNILDRRLVTSGWARQLHENRVEVHVRSAFLQGLLLMQEQDRPTRFARWNTIWQAWSRYLRQENLTAVQACLRYPLSVEHVDKVVIGVDTPAQLSDIIAATEGPLQALPVWPAPIDDELITPSCWNQL